VTDPTVNEPCEALPRTVRALERGMRQGLQVGVQAYVSRRGRPVADFAMGEARPGVPMTADSLSIWLCACKPVGAVAVAQLWERGALALDDRVVRYLPEFGAGGKERITIRHLLTHTGGFRFAGRDGTAGWDYLVSIPWEEMLQRICAEPIEAGWLPGRKAGYHASSSWFVLGEIVRRVDGRDYDRYVRDEIFVPLGMLDCWVGVPRERYREYGDRVVVPHLTVGRGRAPLFDLVREDSAARVVPGGSGAGPMRELGRLYEMLLFRGQRDGACLLSPQAVEALLARQCAGMRDETFGIVSNWGLGVSVEDIMFGRHRSRRAFGLGGVESSTAFADPEYGLVVAVYFNGMPGPMPHFRRAHALATAIYEDLGLVRAADAVAVAS
jgi:CubicO group peptidase (beta-lactamase class C family)